MWCSSFFLYLHSSSSLAQPWFLCLSGFVVLAEDKTLLINVAVKRACFLVLNWTSSSKDTFWNLGYTGYTWIYTSSCTMLCSSRCIRSKAQHVPLLPLPFTQNLRNRMTRNSAEPKSVSAGRFETEFSALRLSWEYWTVLQLFFPRV